MFVEQGGEEFTEFIGQDEVETALLLAVICRDKQEFSQRIVVFAVGPDNTGVGTFLDEIF